MSLRRAIQMVLMPCVLVLAVGSAVARPRSIKPGTRDLVGLSLFFGTAAQGRAAARASNAPTVDRSE